MSVRRFCVILQKSDEHMELMAEMLGIDLEQMRYWLCHRKIVTATEVLNKPLTAAQVFALFRLFLGTF